MNTRNLQSCLALALTLFCSSAWSSNWSVGIYLESLQISNLPAAQQGVGDSALALGGEAAYEPENWQIGMGLSLVSFDDKNEFSQTVEGAGLFNNGDISTESSDATGIMLYVDAGPQYKAMDNRLELTAKLGLAYLDADRSIANCSDCYEESINLDAGGYAKLAATYRYDWGGLALGLTSYFDDDLDNSVYLMFKIQ